MKAVRLYGPMDLRTDEIETPSPGPGEVLIKTECCGLCGSDRPRVLEGDVPFFPNTIGHEFSATVVETGRDVTSVKPGDLVVPMALIVCHQCEHCKNGNFGQCENSRFIGLRVPDCGAFAQYNVLPEINLLKAPKGMDRVTATFVEPAAVALHSILKIGMKPGQDVVIVGAGTIGQMLIQSVRAMGAKRIFVFDINDDQLVLAKKFGADFTYRSDERADFKKYMEDCGGYGCPYVFEAVGLQSTVMLALEAAKVHADIAMLGHLGKPIAFSHDHARMWLVKEVNISGIWMSYDLNYPGDAWRLAIYYISTGKIDVQSMLYKKAYSKDMMELFEEWKIPGKVKGKMVIDFSDL